MSQLEDFLAFLAKQEGALHRKRGVLGFLRAYAGLFLALAALASGIATYMALTEAPPFGSDSNTVIWLLNLDLLLLLMLIALIARRIVGVWSGRRRGLAGAHLHVRLVYIFSLLAAAPAIIMTVFSAVFFTFGVQTWFSQRVQTAVYESQAVAEAYLEEHRQVIRADALAMANDIDRQAPLLAASEPAFDSVMQTQSMLRNFSEALVFDSGGRVLARSGLTFALEFESVPDEAIAQARSGEVVIMTGENDDRVRALLRLNNFVETYLYVGRLVDPKVLSHVASTRQASREYADLEQKHGDLQIQVSLIFVVVGLVLLLTAMWFGLVLARQLVDPIGTLITAADRVRAGDLKARVSEQQKVHEFDHLARAFNRMTQQIEEQQRELIEANRQMDRRRLFTETVLAGVSSGVLGLDTRHRITIANASACALLGYTPQDLSGLMVEEIMPGIGESLAAAHANPERIYQTEITFAPQEKGRRIFLVRISIEVLGEKDTGAVMTFDDITDLQSAQRKAAWSDVARRIAHEIKNPLTPIQLSAERLKRKYLGQISDDPQTFAQCTDTIIRQVEDIGRMVNEFSAFARMPEPAMKQGDLAAHAREVLFLQRQAHADIEFSFNDLLGRDGDSRARFDSAQMRQALNNLVQNAIDAIEGQSATDAAHASRGKVAVWLMGDPSGGLCLLVNDDGPGLPPSEDAESLAEPYVTHKAKGTGLGLAIVKKIMEDHNGRLIIGMPAWLSQVPQWSPLGGAVLGLSLPAESGQESGGRAVA